MVQIMEQVHRVLAPWGSLWLNVGNSYACSPNGRSAAAAKAAGNDDRTFRDKPDVGRAGRTARVGTTRANVQARCPIGDGFKEKDLIMQGPILALALQGHSTVLGVDLDRCAALLDEAAAVGDWETVSAVSGMLRVWAEASMFLSPAWLRSDCLWWKRNAMPSSVEDRPGVDHEYVFLLTKSPRYYYDGFPVRERATRHRTYPTWEERKAKGAPMRRGDPRQSGDICNYAGIGGDGEWRNLRTTWDILPEPSREDHFASFPESLPRRCVLASTSEAGYCASCGKPYTRIVEKSRGTTDKSWQIPMWVRDAPGYRVEHRGWKASCKCDAPTRPGVVLDPFAGTGTTLLAAVQLGRQAIGIELNEKDCKTTRKRLLGARLPIPGLMVTEDEDIALQE